MNSELLDDLNDLDYLDKEAPEYIYAGFWKRLGAVILDGIAIFVILTIWVVAAELVGLVLPSGSSYFLQDICIPIIMFLYFPLWESSNSQGSIGKQILGIKVIDKDGHRLTFWRALARFFAKSLSYSVGAIGFIMIAFMDKKQGLHDLIVNTYVVDK